MKENCEATMELCFRRDTAKSLSQSSENLSEHWTLKNRKIKNKNPNIEKHKGKKIVKNLMKRNGKAAYDPDPSNVGDGD